MHSIYIINLKGVVGIGLQIKRCLVYLILTTIFTAIFIVSIQAQKKTIGLQTYKTWESLKSYGLSKDGCYAWYTSGTDQNKKLSVVQSNNGRRCLIKDVKDNPILSTDSKSLIFSKSDSIGVLTLNDFYIRYIKNVTAFKYPEMGLIDWITFKRSNKLVLRNIRSNKELIFPEGTDATFNKQGSLLAVRGTDSLTIIDLKSLKETNIYLSRKVKQFCFSNDGQQLAFVEHTGSFRRVFCYNSQTNKKKLLIDSSLPSLNSTYEMSFNNLAFSTDDHSIFFHRKTRRDKDVSHYIKVTDKVRIWSYQDEYPQSYQWAQGMFQDQELKSSINIVTGLVVNLESEDSMVVGEGGRFVLIATRTNEVKEGTWKSEPLKYQLVSLADGKRINFLSEYDNISQIRLSPKGKFVTWQKHGNVNEIYTYEISSRLTHNITKDIGNHSSSISDPSRLGYFDIVNGKWACNDRVFLVADPFDIWQIDPNGKNKPLNITNEYGKKNNIQLNLIESDQDLNNMRINGQILISGFDNLSKNNGIFTSVLSRIRNPKVLLPMQNVLVHAPSNASPFFHAFGKAGEKYLFKIESTTSSKNLIVVENSGKRITLSNIHPESQYNWLKSSLHTWKTPIGEQLQGILYVPENLDTTKMHPIIFHYYELESQNAFRFVEPKFGASRLDIARFVSNGYLVFVPDISRKKSKNGWSALLSVESAAKYLTSKYSWINKNKMGLQGHSFGGYRTNFIVAHSNTFAAAQASNGLSDMVSMYGELIFGGRTAIDLIESGQPDLGYGLWESRDVYIDNSPIFFANQVQTPLLLAHGNKDDAAPYKQSLEFFIALRRLGKPAWLLEYQDQGHIISGDCGDDFVIRQQQFFDHYLKDYPAPEWMLRPLSAREQLENSGIGILKNN